MFRIFKGKRENKKPWQLVSLIFLVGAIVAGVLLVKQSQDIREKAAGDTCLQLRGDCVSEPECRHPDKKRRTDDCSVGDLVCCYEPSDDGGGGGGNHTKCDADNPCGGGSCSTRFKRCFTNQQCKRWDRILKCEK